MCQRNLDFNENLWTIMCQRNLVENEEISRTIMCQRNLDENEISKKLTH